MLLAEVDVVRLAVGEETPDDRLLEFGLLCSGVVGFRRDGRFLGVVVPHERHAEAGFLRAALEHLGDAGGNDVAAVAQFENHVADLPGPLGNGHTVAAEAGEHLGVEAGNEAIRTEAIDQAGRLRCDRCGIPEGLRRIVVPVVGVVVQDVEIQTGGAGLVLGSGSVCQCRSHGGGHLRVGGFGVVLLLVLGRHSSVSCVMVAESKSIMFGSTTLPASSFQVGRVSVAWSKVRLMPSSTLTLTVARVWIFHGISKVPSDRHTRR